MSVKAENGSVRVLDICLAVCFAVFLISNCGGGGGSSSGGGGSGDPTTPTALNATPVSSDQINITWNPSTDDVGVTAYMVYGGSFSTRVTMGTSTSDTGLSPGTMYCYSVAAMDGSGNMSPQTSAACCTTDPGSGTQWTTILAGTDMNMEAVVWNGSKLVAVGDDDEILISSDGVNWTSYTPSFMSPQGINDIVWNGTNFVGVEGWTYTSPDGIAWNLNATTFDTLNGVTWSSTLGLHITVGEDGLIMSSPDGATWTTETSPTSSWLNDVTWANGKFLAVGENGTIVSSNDGSTWSTETSGTTGSLNGVTWSGTEFVTVGLNDVLISADGSSWTAGTAPPAYLESVAWSSSLGLYAAVGWNGDLFTSPDGGTWTDRAPTTYSPSYEDVTWTGTSFVAVGDRGEIVTSDDGLTWTIRTSGSDIESVIWDGVQFVAVGDEGKVLTSADGDTWLYGSSGDGGHYHRDIAWNGSLYAVGSQSHIYTIGAGGWSAGQWLGATTSCSGVFWDGSQFVCVGSGTGGASTWTSPDGGTFTWHDPGTGSMSALMDVTWNGTDQYLAVGYYGMILSSSDASVWSTETTGIGDNLYGVNWSGSQYVAVGASGTIVSSPDGAVWTTQDSTVTNLLYDVTWTGTEYVAVGMTGRILTSPDGAVWNADQHTFTAYKGVAWSGADLVIVGNDGTVVKRQ